MHTLFPIGMVPLAAAERHAPGVDVVSFQCISEDSIVAEIFARTDATLGLRCFGWVAWRDADGEVRGHSWWEIAGLDNFILDSLNAAKERADQILAQSGLTPASWRDA